MGSRFRWSAAAILAATLVASTAHAQTAADRETARTLMEQGRDLRDKGDFKQALKRFQAANDIMHVPSTALHVALMQAKLGLLVEARDTIASIQRMPEKPNDPQPFKEARADADKLDAQLAPRVPAIMITVKGAAQGEEPKLTIDDVEVPPAVEGLPRSVDPGHHVIVAKTPTGAGQAQVDVKEGEKKPVDVTLVAVAPSDNAGGGEEQPGPGQPEAPPQPRRTHKPGTLTFVGIGVAGAGLITGTVTGIMVMSTKSKLTSECPNNVCGPGPGTSDLNSANMLAHVAEIGFAVAGAGAVVAVVSLIVGHQEKAPTQPVQGKLVVAPWLGLGSAGLRGSF